jgi:glucose/arabinose dehydrogenase
MRRPDAAAVSLLAVLTLAACSPTVSDPVVTSEPPRPSPTATSAAPEPTPTASAAPLPRTPETFVDGLSAPWSIVFAGESVLVSERDSGRILEVLADGATREVATIAGVQHGGEGGLLGLALHNSSLYVYSTASSGNRVERYLLRGGVGSWRLSEPRTVIDGLPAANVHNAGRIAFGPDGKLYVAVGDAGDRPASQDPDALNGKILRLESDGSVPADNPTSGSPVYSLGHRNVQGLAWDEDGRLFASEFGQNTWDELNIIEPGGNYGWPVVEGRAGWGDYIDPVAQWATSEASPSGIAIVDGAVVIANLRGEVLRVVSVDDPSRTRDLYAGEYGRLRDVKIGPDGAVWILTNNTDGRGDPRPGDDRILRIAPAEVTAGL